MKALSRVNVVLGAWLIVTGFALSTAKGSVMAEEIVLGCIIAVLAWISAARRNPTISWLVAVAVMFTSPCSEVPACPTPSMS